MVRLSDITDNETLDYGKHLVKVSDARNTTKEGDLLLLSDKKIGTDTSIW